MTRAFRERWYPTALATAVPVAWALAGLRLPAMHDMWVIVPSVALAFSAFGVVWMIWGMVTADTPLSADVRAVSKIASRISEYAIAALVGGLATLASTAAWSLDDHHWLPEITWVASTVYCAASLWRLARIVYQWNAATASESESATVR